jgi:hypothetical protein
VGELLAIVTTSDHRRLIIYSTRRWLFFKAGFAG